MLSFLQFITEALTATKPSLTGSFWYNSGTGQFHDLNGERGVTEPSTFHVGFVANNPHLFGITEAQIQDAIKTHKSFTPSTPAEKVLKQIKFGEIDTHPAVDDLIMGKGWVRVHGSHQGNMYVQGKTKGLHKLAQQVQQNFPNIKSINMDVHGAKQEYGHMDSSIRGMSHVLEGSEDIEQFVSSGGKPNRRYTRVIRVGD